MKDADGFKALYAEDAYQHVKDGTAYPTVLFITGANDARVDPFELFKMTARLQAATSSKNPILLRVDEDAGHGFGSTKTQRDLISADQAALLLSLAGSCGPLVCCPINNIAFVAIKMGRRQGGPSRTGGRGRISRLIRNRGATQPPAHFHRNPPARPVGCFSASLARPV